MADSSQTQLYFVEETTWGTTPAAALKELRFTGESLGFNIETVTSNEIRADRQVSDLIQTNASASGAVNFELSYGAYDELIAAALFGDWTATADGHRLANGTTRKSFTLEKYFSDVGQYMSFTGMVVGGMTLNIETGAILTGEFSFTGASGARATATVGTGAATAGPTAEVMNAVANVGEIKEAGVAISGICISSLSINVDNGLRAINCVGTLGASDIGAGRCNVTGSLSAYFADGALYDKYLGNTATSLSFKVTGNDGASYTFTLPRIKLTQGTVQAGGIDQDVMAEFQFQALADPTDGETLQITRAAAPAA